MKLRDVISNEAKEKLNDIKINKKLTNREWLDLMGTNRDTYKRVRGAVRRK